MRKSPNKEEKYQQKKKWAKNRKWEIHTEKEIQVFNINKKCSIALAIKHKQKQE